MAEAITKTRSIAEKEKQRQQDDDKIGGEQKDVLRDIGHVGNEKTRRRLRALRQCLVPVDIEVETIEFQAEHVPPAEKRLNPRLLLPGFEALSSDERSHRSHQQDDLLREKANHSHTG